MSPGQLLIATRPWSFVMTAAAVTGAAAYSFHSTGAFDPALYLITLVGVTLLHAAANVLNDYYDAKRGIDIEGAPTTRYRPHPIIAGMMNPTSVRNYGLSLLIAGLSFAAFLSALRYLLAPLLALVGAFLLLTYSGPLGYKYRALGELGVFLAWGVFIWIGTHYVMTGSLALEPALVGTPVGLLVAAVLTANNLRDIEYDRSRGAITLVSLLGLRRGVTFYSVELILPYPITIILSLAGVIPLTSLLTLITLPSSLKLMRAFRESVPDAADPMTAKLVQNFSLLYIAGILLGSLIGP